MKILFLDLDNTLFSPRQIHPAQVNDFFIFLFKLIPPARRKSEKVVYEHFVRLSLSELLDLYQIDKNQFKERYKERKLFTRDIHLSPYEDYNHIKNSNTRKFLVTTGLTGFQKFKIKNLGIEYDFEEIVIDDPVFNPIGKRKAFLYLMDKHNLKHNRIWVIGDNPGSEIQAGIELGLKTILIDRKRQSSNDKLETITSFSELKL